MSCSGCSIGELFKVRGLAALSVNDPEIKYTCMLTDSSLPSVPRAECCGQ